MYLYLLTIDHNTQIVWSDDGWPHGRLCGPVPEARRQHGHVWELCFRQCAYTIAVALYFELVIGSVIGPHTIAVALHLRLGYTRSLKFATGF